MAETETYCEILHKGTLFGEKIKRPQINNEDSLQLAAEGSFPLLSTMAKPVLAVSDKPLITAQIRLFCS